VENTLSNGVYDVEFNDKYTSLRLVKDKVGYGSQDRVGKQENKNYPLVKNTRARQAKKPSFTRVSLFIT